MRSGSGFVAAGVLAALMVMGGSTQAMAVPPNSTAEIAGSADSADWPPPIRAMNDEEKAAAGCVASAAGTTALVYLIGPTEFVLTVVGGLIVPSTSAALFVGLISTVTSMACGAAAAMTPAVLWVWRHFIESGEQSVAAADPFRREVAGLGPRHGAAGAAAPATAALMISQAPGVGQ